jgi:Kef-type K+ transport system membrane component KefB/Trk K+ transport system NAD-binding subunit
MFYEIAIILGLATLLGVLGQKLRQPLIIMFLATGIIAGPSGIGVIESYEQIAFLGHMGISLLLFIVGLKLDLNLIRTTGPVALATGLGQIIFTSIFGLLIALALDFSFISSVYIAVTLTFSSTIIIVKLLSDKKEIDSLHGQIALGFLIVQDIAAILALVGLSFFGAKTPGQGTVTVTILIIILKGLGLAGTVLLLMRYVLPILMRRFASSQEILTLFSIAWAVVLGSVSDYLGFSKEVGAFIAGVSLASTDYRDAIGARLTSLRDFLLLFFFIDLGARLDWTAVGSQVESSIILSLFVLIGNPIVVLAIMGFMGYRRRTSFMAGLTVAQISEFSLIVAALGLSIGHITPEVMGLVTLVGVVTIFASTYMILYSGFLYRHLSAPLMIFERRHPYREAAVCSLQDTPSVDVILLGLGNYGSELAEYLLRRRKNIIGVDFDPTVLKQWSSRGVSVLYGDMADPEIHEHLPLNKVRWVVSTIRVKELNLSLLQLLKNRGYRGKVALTAINQEEAKIFEAAGAQVVFRPFSDAAEQAADSLTHAMDVLMDNIDWAIALQEVRLQSGSHFAGKTVKEIPLRATTGVLILAVSRAGRVHYDPGPDFQIFPGDRLILVGTPEELRKAEKFLGLIQDAESPEGKDSFKIYEISISEDWQEAGNTIAELQIRQRYGISIVGIRRGEHQITAPGPHEKLSGGDLLIVIGMAGAIERLQNKNPFQTTPIE